MAKEKVKMYVSVVNQSVHAHKDDSPWEYEVEMDKEFLPVFRQLFAQMSRLEFRNFLRSHLPYIPYHYDRDNHEVDNRMMKVYALVHEFTDEESKRFIEQMPFFASTR